MWDFEDTNISAWYFPIWRNYCNRASNHQSCPTQSKDIDIIMNAAVTCSIVVQEIECHRKDICIEGGRLVQMKRGKFVQDETKTAS